MTDKEFLVEANLQDLIKMIMTDTGISVTDAMRKLYVTEVFEKLQNYDTGLYLESPAYIYDLYLNEQKNHRLVQEEI